MKKVCLILESRQQGKHSHLISIENEPSKAHRDAKSSSCTLVKQAILIGFNSREVFPGKDKQLLVALASSRGPSLAGRKGRAIFGQLFWES